MNLTRRRFAALAGSTVVLGAVPSRAVAQPAPPVRTALSKFMLDNERVASLRKGFAVMQARKPSDPYSYFFQAAIHAYNKAVLAEGKARDAGVATVNKARYWKQCPHFKKCSADFLIWHRAYLYHFERLLRDAAQDATLALPYWDYNNPEKRGFPEAFAPEFLDAAKKTPNPLFHRNRDAAFVEGRSEISAAVSAATVARQAPTFFHETGVQGFGGDTFPFDRTQVGLVTQRPHNDIHLIVGGKIGNNDDAALGTMADIETASFDPIFWVHHANIDRLWTEWEVQPGRRWGALPTDSWLDEKPWVFIDTDGKDVGETRRFYMTRASLAVRYDTDDASKTPLRLPDKAVLSASTSDTSTQMSMHTKSIPGMAMTAPVLPHEIFTASAAVTVSSRHGIAKPVTLTMPGRNPAEPVTTMASRAAAPNRQRIMLEISGITFNTMPKTGYAVWLEVNGKRSLAGLIDLFSAAPHEMPGMAMASIASQRFDVTNILKDSNGRFTLHIEPDALTETRKGHPLSDPATVSIASFRLFTE